MKLLLSMRSLIKRGIVLKTYVTTYSTRIWGKGCSSLCCRPPCSAGVLRAQELLCHLELVGRARTVVTQPRRVLSLVHKQKTMTRPEPQLRGRPISECMEVIALGLSNNWETPEERDGTGGSYGRREYNELLKCGY